MQITSRLLAIGAFLGLAACGGGGSGSDGGGGPTPLTVTNTTPTNGATAVGRKSDIVLTFSTTLDPTTLGFNTVSMTTAAGNPPIIVSAAGNTLRITPLFALAPVVPYRVTVGTELRSAGGQPLSEPFVLNFTTADRQWQTPTRIEPVGPTTAERPRVVVDRNGNAIAVWQRRDGVTRSIWSNRYAVGAGWGTAVQISTPESTETNADLPELDVDALGNAIVVWQQSDNGVFSVWSNRYTAGTGWGTPSRIQTRTSTTGDGIQPHVAIDALGNALAVWAQFESGLFEIWSNRYSAGGSWGTAVQVETNPGNADSPRVAFDGPSGRAFAVWNQAAGTACTCIWSNQYTVASGWGTPQMIASGSALSAFLPQIAVDGFGNAYAVWTQSEDGQHFDIWSNRFAAGGTWGTPAMIDDQTGGSGSPKIVADLNGNAYVVWEQSQPNAPGATIRWNRYRAGTGWGTPGRIASATDVSSGTGGNPDLAFDPNGIVHAVWEHDDGVQIHVRSSRLTTPASDWGPPLDARSTDSVEEPRLAVDSNGDVTAVWEQRDGAGVAVWSNRFE